METVHFVRPRLSVMTTAVGKSGNSDSPTISYSSQALVAHPTGSTERSQTTIENPWYNITNTPTNHKSPLKNFLVLCEGAGFPCLGTKAGSPGETGGVDIR